MLPAEENLKQEPWNKNLHEIRNGPELKLPECIVIGVQVVS